MDYKTRRQRRLDAFSEYGRVRRPPVGAADVALLRRATLQEGAGHDDGGSGPILDHIFITVTKIRASIAFYEAALASLGIEMDFGLDIGM